MKDAVAAFDSFAGQYAKQLIARVPLTPARRVRLERAHFHDLGRASELFNNIFDINILDNIDPDDLDFIKRMFHRRHVYEHNGGEADAKYIADSGDNVRVKQALRETKESAHRTATLVLKVGASLHNGFHSIFPPLDGPIRRYESIVKRQRTGV